MRGKVKILRLKRGNVLLNIQQKNLLTYGYIALALISIAIFRIKGLINKVSFRILCSLRKIIYNN